ncbi:DNA polymerase III subunit delta [Thermoanaerobacterium sp. DL9XJH110]|uniref:DNA polymerase III subunit delta n=1 Tax=Thermoanaerobacterium sp. DL9XJH110 TaxID=3386643 RepID=UPI003BB48B74
MGSLSLFYGEEKLPIREEIERIKKEIVPDYLEAVNYIALDGKTVTEDEIINAATTVPMLEKNKLVVVYDARFFEGGSNEKEAEAEERGRLLSFLENIPPYTSIIFTCEQPDKRKKIFKLIQKSGTVREFSAPSQKDKALWIQKRARLYGKQIDLSTAYYLAGNTRDLYQTDAELKKVAAFTGETESIQKKDLELISSKSIESNIFEMMDFVGMKKAARAIKVLNDLILQGEKGIVILFMLSRHIAQLLSVKAMEGAAFQELKDKLGLHPFVLKKAVEQAKNFSVDELKRALNLCQKTDLDIKMGKIDERTGIELLIMSIAKL